MFITVFNVIVCFITTNDTAHWFCNRRFKVRISFMSPKASSFDNIIWENTVSCCSTALCIRVSWRFSLSRNCWLLCELLSWFEFILPFFTDFHNISGKFVSNDDRVISNIRRNSLMICSLFYHFPCRHTDGITHHLNKDLIVLDLWKFKFFQTDIVFCI